MSGHDWRLVPLAAAAWVGAWFGVAGPAWPPGLWFSVLAGVPILAWWFGGHGRGWTALALAVLVTTCALAGLRSQQLHGSEPAGLAAEGAQAVAEVRVTTDPRTLVGAGRPPLVVAPAVLLRLESGGRALATRQQVVVFASAGAAEPLSAVPVGAVVRVTGRLAPTDPGSAEALQLRTNRPIGHVADPQPLDALVNAMRTGLRRAASHSPPAQAALVPSLVVGDTSQIDAEMSEQFRATALSHLLAVSGANLTLMLMVLLWAARGAGVRGWWVRITALLGVGLFVVLCRHEPSVVRAAAMGLVSLSAIGHAAGRRSLRNLALAVLCLMLLDPWLSRSWGFALSVSACCGLVLFAGRWADLLGRWLPRGLAEAICLPLAAQLATQPLVTAMNGQVSLVGVLANIAAAPFVGPVTVLGLAATCLVWMPPAAAVVAWAAGWCVQPIIWVAQIGASLPGAALSWPAGPAGVVLSAVACLLALWLVAHVLVRPALAALLAGALVAALLVRPAPLGWPGGWSAAFCDVGQGDATVLRAGPGAAVVVDAGEEPAAVQRCLDSLGIRRVPMLVLTHFHFDHVGGAVALLRRHRPELVLVSPRASPAAAAAEVVAAAESVGSRVVTAAPGWQTTVGDVQWQTIAAWDESGGQETAVEGESSADNDASIVGLAEVDGLRVLLPGDVEPSGQRRALAEAHAAGWDLDVHVLKLPHHGSARQEAAFFEATGAGLAVASAGRDNPHGHPAPSALRLAHGLGMSVARTDEQGSIAVALADGALTVRHYGPAR